MCVRVLVGGKIASLRVVGRVTGIPSPFVCVADGNCHGVRGLDGVVWAELISSGTFKCKSVASVGLAGYECGMGGRAR